MRAGEVAARADRNAVELLHVTNGESAASTLRRTGLGGAVLPWQDALHEGPVPAAPRVELLRERAAFLSACGWGSTRAILASLERRDRQLFQAFADGVAVVLWFEHDLYDQLQLLDVLALAHEAHAAPQTIVVDAFPGRPSFRGLGELSADELETLWPSRRPASPAALAEAADIWSDLGAPEPTALARRALEGARELPFAAAALSRLLEELPAPGDGLSGTERRALRAITDGARTPAETFLAAQDLEDAPFAGDAWFHRSLAAIGRGDGRLVETRDGDELPRPPPLSDGADFARTTLRLTADGERVLLGEADRVELLGVDRCVGGTHVTPESLWRWDPVGRRVLLSAS
jgi:hypothetical protein